MNMQNAGIRIFVSFLDNLGRFYLTEKVFLVMGKNKLRVGKFWNTQIVF